MNDPEPKEIHLGGVAGTVRSSYCWVCSRTPRAVIDLVVAVRALAGNSRLVMATATRAERWSPP